MGLRGAVVQKSDSNDIFCSWPAEGSEVLPEVPRYYMYYSIYIYIYFFFKKIGVFVKFVRRA